MKKNIIAGIVAVIFIAVAAGATPVSALTVNDIQIQLKELLAKVADLQTQLRVVSGGQTQITTSSTTTGFMPSKHRICSILARNLSQGTRGDDVRGLQEFLSAEGYLSANATGFFGPLTAQAIAKWQSSEGVSSVGTFGPVSRERIKAWCGGGNTGCTKEYMPVCASKPIVCITTPCNPIQRTYGNRCAMSADGATFVHEGICRDIGNRPPVISSFSGPATLAIDTPGTWTIQASGAEGQALSYRVTWGDEFRALPASSNAIVADTFVQTTTFTHSYAQAGTYTVAVIVSDESGAQAKTTSTVKVGGYQPVACTMDAMQCSNGSWVGRSGPDCRFVCPN